MAKRPTQTKKPTETKSDAKAAEQETAVATDTTVADDAGPADDLDAEFEVVILGDAAEQPVRYNINGQEGEIPRNTRVKLRLGIIQILQEAGHTFASSDTLPEPDADGDGAQASAADAATGDGGAPDHGGAGPAVEASTETGEGAQE